MHTNNHRLRHVSSSNSLNLYKSSPGVQGRVGKARAKVSYSAADRKGRAVGEIEMWSQGYIRRWLLSGKGAKTQKLVILQSGPLLESIGRHFLNSLPLLVSLPERWLRNQVYIVATNDRDLKRRIRKVPGVSVTRSFLPIFPRLINLYWQP